MGKTRGAIASGHELTSQAGADMLQEGGNAFDAVLAAMCTACVTEPVLASFGGGGFLLAHQDNQSPVLYDFFTQTPKGKRENCEFFPILADFGTVTQEFHIGEGSIATPGVIKGLFDIHAERGQLPIDMVIEPARKIAKQGHEVNSLQAQIFDIVEPIFTHADDVKALYESSSKPDELLRVGDNFKNPDLADFLDCLAREGSDLFYKGEISALIDQNAKTFGGHLSRTDLETYQVEKRKPLKVDYKRSHFYTNPPPSTGGLLISFALEMVKEAGFRDLEFGSNDHVKRLSQIMALTNHARVEAELAKDAHAAQAKMLHPDFLTLYQNQILGRPKALRGTTHISVLDEDGNAAALTLSNGEGCGKLLGSTGIMLNNMLGEEDINPNGFHQWPNDVRLCSMMAPTLLLRDDGIRVALGSGGSNRIRTAILQVLVNILEFGQSIEEAVIAPRIHYERGLLNIEPGFDNGSIDKLDDYVPEYKIWDEQNLFFGGVHTVRYNTSTQDFEGVGDPRRGGAAIIID